MSNDMFAKVMKQFPPLKKRPSPFGQDGGKAPPPGQEGQPVVMAPPEPKPVDGELARGRMSALRQRIAAGLSSGERKRLMQGMPQFIQSLESSGSDPSVVRDATELMDELSRPAPATGPEAKWPHIRVNPITERIGQKPGTEDREEAEDEEGRNARVRPEPGQRFRPEPSRRFRPEPTGPGAERPSRGVGPRDERHGRPRPRR